MNRASEIQTKINAAMGLLQEASAMLVAEMASPTETAQAVAPVSAVVETFAPPPPRNIAPAAKVLSDCVYQLMTLVHQFYQMNGNVIMANNVNPIFERMRKDLSDAGFTAPA